MKTINEKLLSLRHKCENGDKIKIMILGLGSVGVYLLDYLLRLADSSLEIIVCGRNKDKMTPDVNIVRTGATIRRQLRSNVIIDTCDLENVDSIAQVLKRHQPDFLVNTSRVYAGLKYGSISWHSLRAYGVWTPLSVKFAANIIRACIAADVNPIAINTSYSDAVNPWINNTLGSTFDFGSGNLNHLIPRMKFYIAEKFGVENLNDIDLTLAASHFHDVVISKEGQAEGIELPISVRINNKLVDIDTNEMMQHCAIAMPTDQKRNMMNASSNFDIIYSVLTAIRNHSVMKIHTPGVEGEIGGYPYIIDGSSTPKAFIDTTDFSLEEMRKANRESIYLDGIEDVTTEGNLRYTAELVDKVYEKFGVKLPREFSLQESAQVANLLIEKIITPSINN